MLDNRAVGSYDIVGERGTIVWSTRVADWILNVLNELDEQSTARGSFGARRLVVRSRCATSSKQSSSALRWKVMGQCRFSTLQGPSVTISHPCALRQISTRSTERNTSQWWVMKFNAHLKSECNHIHISEVITHFRRNKTWCRSPAGSSCIRKWTMTSLPPVCPSNNSYSLKMTFNWSVSNRRRSMTSSSHQIDCCHPFDEMMGDSDGMPWKDECYWNVACWRAMTLAGKYDWERDSSTNVRKMTGTTGEKWGEIHCHCSSGNRVNLISPPSRTRMGSSAGWTASQTFFRDCLCRFISWTQKPSRFGSHESRWWDSTFVQVMFMNWTIARWFRTEARKISDLTIRWRLPFGFRKGIRNSVFRISLKGFGRQWSNDQLAQHLGIVLSEQICVSI
jgi:hypothetical protein